MVRKATLGSLRYTASFVAMFGTLPMGTCSSQSMIQRRGDGNFVSDVCWQGGERKDGYEQDED